MKVRPIFDRVLLQPIEQQTETKSGILLPQVAEEKSQRAIVVAVGDGSTMEGKDVGMRVKVGDEVVYSKYSGTEIEQDDKKYVMVRQGDILAIIEK